MLLLIDNYDSFVYNLARYVGLLGMKREVVRHDEITCDQIAAMAPSHILLSPGPCTPNEAGVCLALVERFAGHIPILGVCLGHQVIAQAYGANIIAAKTPHHGKPTVITHQASGLFKQIPSPLTVGRYHSLAVEEASLEAAMQVTARAADGEIMAIAHQLNPLFGLQFHPESILTEHGLDLLRNFLSMNSASLSVQAGIE